MKIAIISILIIILTAVPAAAQIPTPTAISDTINLFYGVEIDSSGMEMPTITLDCDLICFMYQNTVTAFNTNGYLNTATYVVFAFSCLTWIFNEFLGGGEDE